MRSVVECGSWLAGVTDPGYNRLQQRAALQAPERHTLVGVASVPTPVLRWLQKP